MAHGHDHALPAEAIHVPEGHRLTRLPAIALVVGLVSLGLAFVLPSEIEGKFWWSYLTSFMFFLSLGLGGLFFVLVQHATRAGWSVVVRRLAETWASILPVFAVLFLGVLAGMGTLYHHWMHPEGDPILEGKAAYLNTTAWLVRAAIYFGLWSLLGLTFYRRSRKQDETGDPKLSEVSRWWAPLGIAVFALTTTFAAIDWMMSLDPHWFSTIFGVYYFSGSVIAIAAVLAIQVIVLQRAGFLHGVVTTEHLHDLGKMVFAFTVFWTYIAFSQYFLIWYANIPEETMWYEYRSHHGWEAVGVLLMVGHFAVPFLFLMSRHIKRRKSTLVAGAAWMLLMHWVDMVYLVQPAMTHHAGYEGLGLGLQDVLCFVGVGGLVAAAFLRRLTRAPLVPVKDPRLGESLAFENA